MPDSDSDSDIGAHDSKWSNPVDALNEFQPPVNYVFGGDDELPLVGVEQIRYGFQIGGIGLLIAPRANCEVLDPLPISELPNCPAWLCGLINVRGNLVPVFDLTLFLDDNSERPTDRRILILDEGEYAVGVLIDSLPQVPTLEKRLNTLPPIPTHLSEHISSAYYSRDFIWLDFDHRTFFQMLSEQFLA